VSDYNASLPIHSITEGNPVKISRDLTANSASHVVYVNLSDETNQLSINADGSINVEKTKIWDGTNYLDILIANSAYGSTSKGIAIFGKYEATPTTYDDGDAVPLLTDANGKLIVSIDPPYDYVDDDSFTVATDRIVGIGALADETSPDSVDEGDIGIPRMTLDRKLLTRIVGANDANRWDIDSNGYGQIDLAEVSVTAVPVSKDGNANSETNPLYVTIVGKPITTEVHDYNTAVSVAGGGTSSHSYSVSAGKTFLLKRVMCSASGAGRWEVQIGPTASLVTKAVKFTSSAQQNVDFVFDPPIEIVEASGGEQVNVIRENREGASQDIYSTIMGNEI